MPGSESPFFWLRMEWLFQISLTSFSCFWINGKNEYCTDNLNKLNEQSMLCATVKHFIIMVALVKTVFKDHSWEYLEVVFKGRLSLFTDKFGFLDQSVVQKWS